MKSMKRSIALILALMMALSLCPVSVLAEGADELTIDMSDLYWRYEPKDGWRNDAITADPGGHDSVYLATDNEGTPLSGDISVSIAPSEEGKAIGSVKMREGQLVWLRGKNTSVGNKGVITVTCGEKSYKIPVEIEEPWVGVYDGSVMLVPDADNNYYYTSGAETVITFKIREEDVSITKIEEVSSEWVSISENTATVTVPASASGELRFRVCWDENGEQIDREYRFQDENPAFDIYWGTPNDGWNKGTLRKSPGGNNKMYLSLNGEQILAINTDNWEADIDEGLGTVTIMPDGRLSWERSGSISIGSTGVITITNKADSTQTYYIPVEITEPWMCVTNTTNENSELTLPGSDNRYHYIAGTKQTYSVVVPDDVEIIDFFNDTEISNLENDYFKLAFEDNTASFTVPAEMYGSFLLKLKFEDGGSQEIFFEDVAQSDLNLIVEENDLTSEKESYGYVPIGNTGYFIAPVGVISDRISPMGDGYMMFHGDYSVTTAHAVGLYKLAPDGETLELLVGQELKDVVARFNGTLKMDVSLISENNDADIQYPTVREITKTRNPELYNLLVEPDAYPLANLYMFSKYSAAAWCFTVTGTYTHPGGRTEDIVAYGRDEYRLQAEDKVEILNQETPEATVEAVNSLLKWYENKYKDTDEYIFLQVQLPAGEMAGYIEIPKRVDDMIFYGSVNSEEDDENVYEIYTVLRGGIITKNESLRVHGVQFIGSGRGTGTKQQPNIGIRGTAGGEITHCSFTGYDCAVEMNGRAMSVGGVSNSENHIIDGTGSFFYNNDVAFRQNITTVSSGDSSIRNTVMLGNGIDIEFAKIDEGAGWRASIEDTIFVRDGNKNGIRNASSRTYYLPYGTFYNSHSEGNNGKQNPKVDGNVSIAPYYGLTKEGKDALTTNLEIAEMLKNPKYYKNWTSSERLFPKNWRCPVKGDKDLYKIPVSQVEDEGMTIGMMDGEDICANIKLKKD